MEWSKVLELAGSGVIGGVLVTILFLVKERNSTSGKLIDLLMAEREKREARIHNLETKVEELRGEVVSLKIIAALKENPVNVEHPILERDLRESGEDVRADSYR